MAGGPLTDEELAKVCRFKNDRLEIWVERTLEQVQSFMSSGAQIRD